MSKNYIPIIKNSDEEIKELSYKKAYEVYGENLPKIVKDRLETELTAIINNKFSSIYMFVHKIAKYTSKSGNILGIDYSIGNSFVANMLEISDINPLKPHLLCPKCKFTDFTFNELNEHLDVCPICGEKLIKDGCNLPFEIFMGSNLDKQPNFFLRFSYEFKEKAFDYICELLKENKVYKLCERNNFISNEQFCTICTLENSKSNCCKKVRNGNKCSSKGVLILPPNKSIDDYSPICNFQNDNIIYLSASDAFGEPFNQPILGDNTLSILEKLEEITSFDSSKIDFDDKAIIDLLCEKEFLYDYINFNNGTFNNDLASKIIKKTKPKSFNDLVKVYGLTLGEGAFTHYGEDLIDSKIATLDDLISSRDEIMTYLISKGFDRIDAFEIMEFVRKGKILLPKYEAILKMYKVPNWYVLSLGEIKFLYPKSYIIDCVKKLVRIGYFKIYYPKAFNQTILTMNDWGEYN